MFKHEAPAVTGAPANSGAHRHSGYTPAPSQASTGRPIYFRGRVCGYVNGDVFERHFDPELHVLRRHNALCFHREVLEQLQALGVEWIHCITTCNQNSNYWVLLSELLSDGLKVRDSRYGDQLAMPLDRWSARPERQARLL